MRISRAQRYLNGEEVNVRVGVYSGRIGAPLYSVSDVYSSS